MAELSCPPSSSTGAYRLSWEGAADASYQLTELAAGETPVVLYRGADTATTVSGRVEGVYRYELAIDGAAPLACEVEVAPPESGLVIGLFAAGLVITAATVVLIAGGHRRARSDR